MNDPNSNPSLDLLIHDVASKCAALKSAAALLRSASPSEAKELLALMSQQAHELVRILESADIME